jgi:LCP family protein required for cell wall assembly
MARASTATVLKVVIILLAVLIVALVVFAVVDSILSKGVNKPVYNIMILGVDDVSSSTDVMMLVQVDENKGTLNILQLPRDTYINKTVGGYSNISKANSMYAASLSYYKNTVGQGNNQARTSALGDVSKKLSDGLSVPIDFYVLVDTDAFVYIVDKVGGIEYNVPEDMDYDDDVQDLHIHLKAGKQKLNGDMAEQLIRYRTGYTKGDLDRIDLRANFLNEMIKQVMKNIPQDSLVSIATELYSSVVTNAKVGEIVDMIKSIYGVDSSKVNIKTISGSPVQDPDTKLWGYYVLNKKSALEDVNKYLNPGKALEADNFDKNGFFTSTESEEEYINDYYNS